MPIDITVPRLGWSSEEGVFAGWMKQHGDPVASGEPLFALESDKVTMEVESLDSGILHILAGGPEPGGVVLVGQLLGQLLKPGEEGKASATQPDAPAAAPAPLTVDAPVAPGPPLPEALPGRRPASPRARARAKSLGIEIASVQPAPGAKRIVEADVLRAAQARESRPASASRARQVIAARLEESFRTPHFYVHAEVDATSLARLREELLPVVEERRGVRLTYNDLLIKASALALRKVPQANSYWHQGAIVPLETAGIGLAVQTDDALLVPVIRGADSLSIEEIAVARHALVEKCRRGQARPADFEGGSMSISNLGAFGVDRFQAILNPPQSAILAVGGVKKRPFVDGDTVVARLTMPVSLSVDHRVIDGVAAAKLLEALVHLLQSPIRLVV